MEQDEDEKETQKETCIFLFSKLLRGQSKP